MEEQQIAGKLDHAVLVPRRQLQVGNTPVCRQRGIDPEVHATDHTLVCPGIVASSNLHTHNFRGCSPGYQDQQEY
jgi:hypothetical protein